MWSARFSVRVGAPVPSLLLQGSGDEYAANQVMHHQLRPRLTDYLLSSRFWFESFQNWQSEFSRDCLHGLVGGVPSTAMVTGIETGAWRRIPRPDGERNYLVVRDMIGSDARRSARL